MSNKNYPRESSELVRKIGALDFVSGEVKIESVGKINSKNFNNSLIFNKNTKKYIANVSCCGSNYKLCIPIEGNKPNPRYEKKLKKVF